MSVVFHGAGGVRLHLQRHAFANATLADFLDAMGRSSGTDLRPWARSWLERAGLDRLSVDRATGTLRRDEPATPAGRPHTLDVLQLDGAAATGAAVAPAVRDSPPPAAATEGSSSDTTSTYSGASVGYMAAKVETTLLL